MRRARNNDALRAWMLEHAADTLHWLADLGLTFHGPSPEPPNRAPRMHNVVPSAKAYIFALQRLALQHGARLLTDARVCELVKRDGRVVGVRADVDGVERSFQARYGVVLAGGDYSNAPDLIGRYKGDAFAHVEGINKTARGFGHQLALEAGAKLVNMDITYGPELRFAPPKGKSLLKRLPQRGPLHKLMGRLLPFTPKFILDEITKRELVAWQHPENGLFTDGAIMLNDRGERFCNELASPDREVAVAQQPGKRTYILLDECLIRQFSEWPNFISTAPQIAYAYVEDYLRLRKDVAVAAPTLEQIASARSMPTDALRATVDAFNRCAAGEAPDPFGREGDTQRLEGDRWVLLGPAHAVFTTTEGGAAIDRDMRVLDENDQPIPALYAAGMNGSGGMVLWGHGLHIAWAMTSGRLVGRALARTVASG